MVPYHRANRWTLKLVCRHSDGVVTVVDRFKIDPARLDQERSPYESVVAHLDRSVDKIGEYHADRSKYRAKCHHADHATPLNVTASWPRIDDILADLYRRRQELFPVSAHLHLTNLAAILSSSGEIRNSPMGSKDRRQQL